MWWANPVWMNDLWTIMWVPETKIVRHTYLAYYFSKLFQISMFLNYIDVLVEEKQLWFYKCSLSFWCITNISHWNIITKNDSSFSATRFVHQVKRSPRGTQMRFWTFLTPGHNPENTHVGFVEGVTWSHVVIRDLSRKQIFVPHQELQTKILSNWTKSP